MLKVWQSRALWKCNLLYVSGHILNSNDFPLMDGTLSRGHVKWAFIQSLIVLGYNTSYQWRLVRRKPDFFRGRLKKCLFYCQYFPVEAPQVQNDKPAPFKQGAECYLRECLSRNVSLIFRAHPWRMPGARSRKDLWRMR